MGTIPPNDPRSVARQAKEYARAQRAYWRYYRGASRRSIVRPVALILVGVVALLVETGRIPAGAFWNWYGQWWPLLLIGLGVLLLLEYFFDRNNPNAGRGTGGVVWLVIFLVIIGWSVHGTQRSWNWFGNDSSSFWNMMGPEYDHTLHMDQVLKVPKGVTPIVNVDVPRGDVTITASTDGMIHLSGHQVARTGSQDDANRDFDATVPKISATATGANVVVPAKDGTSVDLTLEVPEAAGTVIQSGRGEVTVEGLNGSVDITARRGDVRLAQIGGSAQVKMKQGDFTANGVKGQALVEGSGGDVTLSQIGGDTSIHGEFTGDVHLQEIGGAVSFVSSRTQISVPHLVGQMTLDSGDLGMDRASGPIVIAGRAKNIDLSSIAGDVQIADSDGDVNVAMGLPLGAIRITNRTGSIRLQVPENANFQVTASTSQDESLSSDFPLTAVTRDGAKTLQGQVGSGGPQVELTTTHGSVEISKGPAAQAGVMKSDVPHFTSQKPVKTTVQ
ncbi:MAG: DUF4097 family beta strand repeat-containing protein [Acidobacteriaceae bacterium]